MQHISAALNKGKKKNPYRPDPDNAVRRPDLRIVDSMARRAGHWRKSYVFPTQVTIIEWVRQDHGVVYSRRQLNRHLAGLERDGYIRRLRRHQVDRKARRGWVMRSTLYWILGRFLANLRQAGRALFRMATAHRDTSSGIRVPRAAQYLRTFFKEVHPGGTYPQAPPGKPT